MWKKEYAERRRRKYQESEAERERRRLQGRSSEANKVYMKTYYKNNGSKFKRTRQQQDVVNQRRRERYRNDPEFRERAKQAAKETRVRNPRTRLKQLLREYGMTIEQYENLVLKQNGVCAICKGKSSGDKRSSRLFIDHCHKTGKVRGLLCSPCNLGIGKLRDDPKVLRNAARYLEKSRD